MAKLFFALILPGLFRAVLTMSLTAILAAAVVMLLRLLLKKLGAPRLAVFFLWAVVLFRMVCPASFTSSMSLLALLPQAAVSAPAATAPPLAQNPSALSTPI